MLRSEQKYYTYILVMLAVGLSYWAILRSPLLFVDDAIRVFTNMSINQGVHGRPFADVAYMLLSNGLFVDFSPMTQVLALAAITWAGIRVHDCFLKDAGSVGQGLIAPSYIIVLVFAVFPLHFSIISYRFDALSIGLALLCAALAFVTAARPPQWRGPLPAVGISIGISGALIALSLGLYQPMFGVYACCALFFIGHSLLRHDKPSLAFKKALSFLGAACLGALFYLPVYLAAKQSVQSDFYGVGPHPYVSGHIQIVGFSALFQTVPHNILLFLQTICGYAGRDLPSAVILIMAFFFAGIVIIKKISIFRKISALLLAVCAFLSCAGLQLFLSAPVFVPRTLTPLCAFVACLFLVTLAHMNRPILKKSIVCLGAIMALSSACILSAIGNAQRDQYHYENDVVFDNLATDLMTLYAEHDLKAFYVTPLEPQSCTSLKILKNKYKFLRDVGSMTCTFFTATKFLSYIPVNYIFHAYFNSAVNTETLESVITRHNYTIKKIENGKYAVVLHQFPVEPFTSERFE